MPFLRSHIANRRRMVHNPTGPSFPPPTPEVLPPTGVQPLPQVSASSIPPSSLHFPRILPALAFYSLLYLVFYSFPRAHKDGFLTNIGCMIRYSLQKPAGQEKTDSLAGTAEIP